MWELSNRTRFAAAQTFQRDRAGAEVLIVIVKATFTIASEGGLRVADEQVLVQSTPRHLGAPGRSSLVSDSDFALGKSKTDILLSGHARAPEGRSSAIVQVRVQVGSWEKRVAVFGDRRWNHGLSGWSLSDPAPFDAMPLVYERAFGGVDPANGGEACESNPVGVGFAPPARDGNDRAAPNLEDPGHLLGFPTDRPRSMAFGPIAREWPLRRRLAGTYDDRWRRERRPLVPDDFDDGFWQSAPADQQARVEGGEDVELDGVSTRGVLRFQLPHPLFRFRSRIGGQWVVHPSTIHTVSFELDQDRVVLVYQSALPCHHTLHSLKRTVIEEVEAP